MFYSQIRIVQVKATTSATPKGLSGEEDRSDKLQAYGCGLSLSSEKYLIVLRWVQHCQKFPVLFYFADIFFGLFCLEYCNCINGHSRNVRQRGHYVTHGSHFRLKHPGVVVPGTLRLIISRIRIIWGTSRPCLAILIQYSFDLYSDVLSRSIILTSAFKKIISNTSRYSPSMVEWLSMGQTQKKKRRRRRKGKRTIVGPRNKKALS